MSNNKETKRVIKVNKLKNDKAELQRMCEEAVKLVELYSGITAIQAQQIERIAGANFFWRIVRVFLPVKITSKQIQRKCNEFMKKFNEQKEGVCGDSSSEIES